jgi:XTP/dITP diphosphohydrolase
VLSARFAGGDCDDGENINKLLGLLRDCGNVEDRKAEFVTVVAFAGPMEERIFRGTVKGFITFSPRGNGGFGYDPVFEIHGKGKTFAELSAVEKNKLSHRAVAFRKLVDYMIKGYNKQI